MRMVMGTAVKMAVYGSSSIRSFASSSRSMHGETLLRSHFQTLPSGPKTRNTFWSLVAIIARRAAGVTLNFVCSGAPISQQERRCQLGSVDQSVRNGSQARVGREHAMSGLAPTTVAPKVASICADGPEPGLRCWLSRGSQVTHSMPNAQTTAVS
jgi:hypothetical protein